MVLRPHELRAFGVSSRGPLNLKPTRAEAMEYYRRVTDFYHLPIRYEEQVIGIAPLDEAFQVEAQSKSESRRTYRSRKVIIATGYYDRPNFLGIPGEDLSKVSHYATEGHAFYGRKVAVIGGANSAAITALDLYRHGAEVTLIYRGPELNKHIKYWIRPDIENRIKEKSIHAFFESHVTLKGRGDRLGLDFLPFARRQIAEHEVNVPDHRGENGQETVIA